MPVTPALLEPNTDSDCRAVSESREGPLIGIGHAAAAFGAHRVDRSKAASTAYGARGGPISGARTGFAMP
jgi:hypothetical protein